MHALTKLRTGILISPEKCVNSPLCYTKCYSSKLDSYVFVIVTDQKQQKNLTSGHVIRNKSINHN